MQIYWNKKLSRIIKKIIKKIIENEFIERKGKIKKTKNIQI